jgi:hypothetical protein
MIGGRPFPSAGPRYTAGERHDQKMIEASCGWLD